jgi:GT2 family glycosyltransferase
MSGPSIDIVVATYNRPAYLEVMLRSIRDSAARVPNKVRIIVVDDHSDTDEAHLVAKQFGADYLRLPENLGVAGALYAGFDRVDADLYALWGDDDFLLPNWFPTHLAKIAEGFDIVAGSYWMADSDLTPTRKVILPVATFDELRKGNVQCNDGSLVRREALGDVQFRPERERAMMMTFWLAMAAMGAKFGVVSDPTWLYRRHATNLSNHRSDHDNELRRQAIAPYV